MYDIDAGKVACFAQVHVSLSTHYNYIGWAFFFTFDLTAQIMTSKSAKLNREHYFSNAAAQLFGFLTLELKFAVTICWVMGISLRSFSNCRDHD